MNKSILCLTLAINQHTCACQLPKAGNHGTNCALAFSWSNFASTAAATGHQVVFFNWLNLLDLFLEQHALCVNKIAWSKERTHWLSGLCCICRGDHGCWGCCVTIELDEFVVLNIPCCRFLHLDGPRVHVSNVLGNLLWEIPTPFFPLLRPVL